jgi:hypothetical protein
MKIQEWIDKSRSILTEEEVHSQMASMNTVQLDEESFVTYDYTPQGDVVIYFLNAPSDYEKFQSAFTKIFAGRRIFFLTRRNPRAWERIDKRIKWSGYMMEVDLTRS